MCRKIQNDGNCPTFSHHPYKLLDKAGRYLRKYGCRYLHHHFKATDSSRRGGVLCLECLFCSTSQILLAALLMRLVLHGFAHSAGAGGSRDAGTLGEGEAGTPVGGLAGGGDLLVEFVDLFEGE